jgi:CRP/FNR family transcriptional regulator, cyclic AMP receptor protein
MNPDDNQVKYWHLRESKFFSDLCDEEVMHIAGITKMSRRARGEFVYLTGDYSEKVYFVIMGRVKLTEVLDEGREVLLDIVNNNEIFGDIDALYGTPRAESAQVVEDALLFEVKGRDFEDLLKTHPGIALQVYRLVGLRLRKAEKRLASLKCKDVEARVKEALIDLISAGGTDGRKYPTQLKMTQQEIADLIGASRQETAKVLRRLEGGGVIRLKYRSIIVTREIT